MQRSLNINPRSRASRSRRLSWLMAALMALAMAAFLADISTAKAATPKASVSKPFPHHWAQPPDDGGQDLRIKPEPVANEARKAMAAQATNRIELPDGYGWGSPALARWVARNLENDKSGSVPQATTLYRCDFEKSELDKVPDDFIVLDGAFAVKSAGGKKHLELPGAPVDNYGVLFGPTITNNVEVSARIFGTNKGRRLPVMGVGLNGAGGLRLLVAPGKRVLEIFKGDESVAQAPFDWQPGKWVQVLLQLRKVEGGEWEARGKAWTEGTKEPYTWLVAFKEKSDLSPGRPSVWGSPISSTPILYDDLQVTTVGR